LRSLKNKIKKDTRPPILLNYNLRHLQKHQHIKKVSKMIVLIKTIVPPEESSGPNASNNYVVSLRDPSGEMNGAIMRKSCIEAHPNLCCGCVVVLHQVAYFLLYIYILF